MFPRRQRLAHERDIQKVLRGGRVKRGRFLLVRYRQHGNAAPRFTVVVSARVSKKAVVRNKLKRQVREILKKHVHRFPQQNDYLISLFPRVPTPTWEELKEDLEKLL